MLKSEQEYDKAFERIYSLINSTENLIEVDSPEGEELELLSLLVEKYEREHFPIEAPNPIETIKEIYEGKTDAKLQPIKL